MLSFHWVILAIDANLDIATFQLVDAKHSHDAVEIAATRVEKNKPT